MEFCLLEIQTFPESTDGITEGVKRRSRWTLRWLPILSLYILKLFCYTRIVSLTKWDTLTFKPIMLVYFLKLLLLEVCYKWLVELGVLLRLWLGQAVFENNHKPIQIHENLFYCRLINIKLGEGCVTLDFVDLLFPINTVWPLM